MKQAEATARFMTGENIRIGELFSVEDNDGIKNGKAWYRRTIRVLAGDQFLELGQFGDKPLGAKPDIKPRAKVVVIIEKTTAGKYGVEHKGAVLPLID